MSAGSEIADEYIYPLGFTSAEQIRDQIDAAIAAAIAAVQSERDEEHQKGVTLAKWLATATHERDEAQAAIAAAVAAEREACAKIADEHEDCAHEMLNYRAEDEAQRIAAAIRARNGNGTGRE